MFDVQKLVMESQIATHSTEPAEPETPATGRRGFLKAAAAGALFQILPSRVFSQSPNGKLNIGFIGAGGRGEANIEACYEETVYALCDVDDRRCERMVGEFPAAKYYRDWRVMLEKEGGKLDAVVISTPDHSHAVAAMAAIRMGKHVYVEKPLTHTISEARALLEAARKSGVCTQMGNTGHSTEGARLINEFIRSGAIGEIREVHCVTNRPIWPQDVVRRPESAVPPHLDWDLWQGPCEPKPFADGIVPFYWRGFLDYGSGALGDMGPNIIDHPVWALGLGLPKSVEVVCERKNSKSQLHTYPASCTISYEFDSVEGRPPVKLVWYDGRQQIPRPPGLKGDEKLVENGCIYYGSKHVMMHGSHGGSPRILTDVESFVAPPRTEERSPGHHQEWIDAIKANDRSKAKSNFEVAVPLTEMLLLGCIAVRVGTGTRLAWDPASMKTGNETADGFVHHQYRAGWKLG